MRRAALAAFCGLLLAGCGTTRIVENHTTTIVHTVTVVAFATEMNWLVGTDSFVPRPPKVDFAVDGDLSADHVRWSDWAQPEATAKAVVYWRRYPSNSYGHAVGLLKASGLTYCNGVPFYTMAEAFAPGLPAEFRHITPLATPCHP